MSEFSHLKNKLLAEQVEDQIYHYILDEALEPGAKLPNEFALGEKFRDWEEPREIPQAEVEDTMEVAMPTFTLAFRCPPPGRGEQAIRLEFLADLAAEALFGESSELYLKLYDEGSIDSSFFWS